MCARNPFVIMEEYQKVMYKKRNHSKKKVHKRLNREIVIQSLFDILINSDQIPVPYYACLVGSVARNTHRDNSDVDVICIWKQTPSFHILEETKKIMENTFGTTVDFIIMQYVGSLVKHNEREQSFYENDLSDAVTVIGNNVEDILFSKLVYKLV